jgi:hypothetical protein
MCIPPNTVAEKWWKGNKTPLPMQNSSTTLLNSKRSNIASYTWFYDDVLSNVVGRVHWNRQTLNAKGVDLATVSDEALGLLIVDNCWASWSIRSAGPHEPEDVLIEALAKENPEVSGKAWDNLSKEEQIQAKKSRAKVILGLTKYTARGAAVGSTGTGWSDAGLTKFNDLCKEVVEDRKKDKGAFDDHYQEQRKVGMAGKRKRKKTLR